ncbi:MULTISPECIES: TRAP transporter small permease [Salinicoccus]|uniref:C4-dicarboxylate ABC transporter permease n=1 Tax=Salinicoccus roseus TaxID=45670 RepID=A0A0C2HQN1_9STAP|nr:MULTISPECIES: TRAP transporter small permease [Salinicoccus]KIH71826.1 C4-dicarboxylate ABC transporter permease [Salinicoccus roseus]MCC4721835.1 TRAP transporter small permease [Salinicoccus sp. RF5]MDB0578959.1 TRAP transporter small permease [Salinicoccus roseus]OZT78157.1 TRAP transporter small permease [Salinicoccus roseus]
MIKKFNRIEEGFLIATLVLMVALIFGQVIGRYIFQNAPSWTEEAARYIHIFQVWIGAGYAVKLREHIKVSAFIDLFHGMTRKVLDMVALIIWFLMVLLVAIFGTELVMTTLQYGQVAPATQIPFWLPYLAVPLGALSMMIRLILQMIEIIKKDYDKPGEAAS